MALVIQDMLMRMVKDWRIIDSCRLRVQMLPFLADRICEPEHAANNEYLWNA